MINPCTTRNKHHTLEKKKPTRTLNPHQTPPQKKNFGNVQHCNNSTHPLSTKLDNRHGTDDRRWRGRSLNEVDV